MEGLESNEYTDRRHQPPNQYLKRCMMFQTNSCPAEQGGKWDEGKPEHGNRQTQNRYASSHAYRVQTQFRESVIDYKTNQSGEYRGDQAGGEDDRSFRQH